MHCSRCGSPLASGAQFCSNCGLIIPGSSLAKSSQPLPASPRPPTPRPLPRVVSDPRLLTLSRLWTAIAGLAFVVAICSFGWLIFALIGPTRQTVAAFPGSRVITTQPFAIAAVFGDVLIAGLIGAVALSVAWGVARETSWGLPLALLVSLPIFAVVPIGTALSLYTFYVFSTQKSSSPS